jgi:ankyrin repeat protein
VQVFCSFGRKGKKMKNIKQTPPIKKSKRDIQLLFQAIDDEQVYCLEFLIRIGVNVNTKNDGIPPLHWAVSDGKFDAVKTLLCAGADINIQENGSGNTPLHEAITDDFFEIARFFILQGADVNIKNSSGDTPLHYAVRRKDIDTVRCLISQGADILSKNNEGKTPLDLAVELFWYKDIAQLFRTEKNKH